MFRRIVDEYFENPDGSMCREETCYIKSSEESEEEELLYYKTREGFKSEGVIPITKETFKKELDRQEKLIKEHKIEKQLEKQANKEKSTRELEKLGLSPEVIDSILN